MTELKTNEISTSQSQGEKEKKPYTSPELAFYGDLKEITQMPGGSIDTEGFSGKQHKQNLP